MSNLPSMRPILLCLALTGFASSAFADIIILKNGEKIEGKVTSQSATELVLEVKVSSSITDTRTIAKAEVEKIETAQPDEVAWKALKELKLGTNSLSADGYEANIRPLKAFTTQFSTSTHLADAQKLLSGFEEEKRRVTGGEVKLNGQWISREEAERERYQINGQLAFTHMKNQSTRGDLVGALNTFDGIERILPGSAIFPDAVELALRILPTLQAEVARRQQNLASEVAEREKGLQLASDTKKAELLAATQREEATADAALAASDKSGLRWPPLLVRSEKSLTTLAGKINEDLARLKALNLPAMRSSVALTTEAKMLVVRLNPTLAAENLRKATELWPANEQATRLQASLAAPSDPNAEKPAEPATAAAGAPSSSPAALPAPAEPAPGEPSTPAPSDSPAPKEPVPAPAAEESAPVEESSDSADEKPFLLTIRGAGTVLGGLGLLAFLVSFRRKRQAEDPDPAE